MDTEWQAIPFPNPISIMQRPRDCRAHNRALSWEPKAFVLDMMQREIIRRRQIAGLREAASRLTAAFRQTRPDLLSWRKMRVMRNILIHGYDQVYLDSVGEVITQDIRFWGRPSRFRSAAHP